MQYYFTLLFKSKRN